MSAADALTQARAAGVMVAVDGDDLALAASASPPAEVRDILARHKVGIMIQPRAGNDGWSSMDWLEFFGQLVTSAEVDVGLRRDVAEARAFSCCTGEWLQRNPARSPSGRCDQGDQSKGLLLPYLTCSSAKDSAHTWLHQECSLP